MTTTELFNKIAHKVAQLKKAEARVVEDYNKFNLNNYYATRKVLNELALELVEMTK